jgi:hypothetical protein
MERKYLNIKREVRNYYQVGYQDVIEVLGEVLNYLRGA